MPNYFHIFTPGPNGRWCQLQNTSHRKMHKSRPNFFLKNFLFFNRWISLHDDVFASENNCRHPLLILKRVCQSLQHPRSSTLPLHRRLKSRPLLSHREVKKLSRLSQWFRVPISWTKGMMGLQYLRHYPQDPHLGRDNCREDQQGLLP